MAHKEDDAAKTIQLEMDGNRLLAALQQAGLDFRRVDLEELLGSGEDARALESELRAMATSTEGSWEVEGGVQITYD